MKGSSSIFSVTQITASNSKRRSIAFLRIQKADITFFSKLHNYQFQTFIKPKAIKNQHKKNILQNNR